MLLNDDYKKGDNAIIIEQGFPHHNILLELFDAALERKDWYNASHCIQLIAFYQERANLEPLIAKVEAKCSLTPIQRRMLLNFMKLRQ